MSVTIILTLGMVSVCAACPPPGFSHDFGLPLKPEFISGQPVRPIGFQSNWGLV